LTYVIFEVNFGGFPHTKVMESFNTFAKNEVRWPVVV
jgi:hypothetical protein